MRLVFVIAALLAMSAYGAVAQAAIISTVNISNGTGVTGDVGHSAYAGKARKLGSHNDRVEWEQLYTVPAGEIVHSATLKLTFDDDQDGPEWGRLFLSRDKGNTWNTIESRLWIDPGTYNWDVLSYLDNGSLWAKVMGYGNGADFFFDKSVLELHTKPVPIPGAIWLLGAGVLGLVGLRRKLSNDI